MKPKLSELNGATVVNIYIGAQGAIVMSFDNGMTVRVHVHAMDSAGRDYEHDVPSIYVNRVLEPARPSR